MKIAVISGNKTSMEDIRKALSDKAASVHSCSFTEGSLAQVGTVADRKDPDILIVDSVCRDAADIEALKPVGQRHPHMNFILISTDPTPELLMTAIHIGVREFLKSPVKPETLLAALSHIEQNLIPATPPRRKGAVLAFIACKGGSGATFLATNLAYQLATEQNKRVVLLDLNLNFGDAALFVSDNLPKSNLADVAQSIARLDASFLAASMVKVTPNFSVLAAPESLERAVDVKPEHVEAIIKLAAYEYDCVVLDVGRNLSPVSISALDLADRIFPVLQLTLPFIRDAKRLFSTMRSLSYTDDKVNPIVNRFEAGGDIQLPDVEHTLGRKILITIPNSFKAVSASVNQGIPIAKIEQNNPVTKSLRSLAKQLFPSNPGNEGGWLSHVFGKA